MNRALRIRQKEITAICRGAEKAGHIAVVEIGGMVIKLVPEKLAKLPQAEVDEEEDFRL